VHANWCAVHVLWSYFPAVCCCLLDLLTPSLFGVFLSNSVGFEAETRQWRTRARVPDALTDVWDGTQWADWQNLGGRPFLSGDGLALSLNLDWFTPFEGRSYSVGVLFVVCLNLPRDVRYLRQNMILLGVIPGPSEPSNLQPFLQPVVDELLQLYDGVSFRTAEAPEGKVYRAALFMINSDIPAARKAGGFVGCMAHRGCSYCFHWFPSCEVATAFYQSLSSWLSISRSLALLMWLGSMDLPCCAVPR
jgi:hypothetical protein